MTAVDKPCQIHIPDMLVGMVVSDGYVASIGRWWAEGWEVTSSKSMLTKAVRACKKPTSHQGSCNIDSNQQQPPWKSDLENNVWFNS